MDRRNIVLIGPMGSGKSTLGHGLAMRLGRPHVDTDHFFVARNGPIPEYFVTHGEHAFRAVEEDIVAELLDAPRPSVISLGGGSILSPRTRDSLGSHAVVMLDMTPAQAALRLGDGRTRPMLSQGGADPLQRWERVYHERRHLYRRCADLVLSADDTTIEARVDTIVSELGLLKNDPMRHPMHPTTRARTP